MKKYYVTIFPYFLKKVAKFPEMFFEKLLLYLDSSFNLVASFELFKEVLKIIQCLLINISWDAN
jgi:glucan phosphoethanolaminetransferase (alkaline phosphatase superfamily)